MKYYPRAIACAIAKGWVATVVPPTERAVLSKLVIPVIVEPEKVIALVGIADKVFVPPLIDLLVNVSAVAYIPALIWANVALPSVPPSETRNRSVSQVFYLLNLSLHQY